MTIDELKACHYINVSKADKYSYLLKDDEDYIVDEHIKVSIQFTIELLEAYAYRFSLGVPMNIILEDTRELKEQIKEKYNESKA